MRLGAGRNYQQGRKAQVLQGGDIRRFKAEIFVARGIAS
jgi:hypothetical protein